MHSYTAYLQKYSRSWRFNLVGLSEISTNAASTNTTTNTISVSGNWDFTFNNSYENKFNGTNFYQTTNSPVPIPDIIPLALTQIGEDVIGTGTLNSVQYTLSGQIATDLFSFTMLSGYTNSAMTLTSAHVAVGTNSMSGDYFANITNNLSAIHSGTVSADKQ